jgi:sigma-B regulation protein RsbU (phosphoserine phosphatase)
MQTNRNLTLALLDYEPASARSDGKGTIKISGQHESIIVVRQGGLIELIDTLDLGFPLGLDDNIAHLIDQKTIHLQPGDGLVLYTDGITEAENSQNQLYGLERLCQIVAERWAEPAETIKAAVIADVHQFIGDHTIYDDIALMVIKQR